MYEFLEEVNKRPITYSSYSPGAIWNDPHISKMLLSCHLDKDIDMASRNHRFIESSVEWINKIIPVKGKFVCDFGCGPGLYTSLLAKNGAIVTGIDISENSINYAKEYAKENRLNINYILKNYLFWDSSKKFDLFLMIYCDFCSLSPVQRSEILQKFRNHLTKDGYIILDVYSEKAYYSSTEVSYYERNMHNGFWSDKEYYGFTNSFKYDREMVTLDKYTIVEEESTKTLYNWLQYYNLERLKKEFLLNGLKIENVYSDVAGSPYTGNSEEIAVVAKLK